MLVDDRVAGVEFERTELDGNGQLKSTGATYTLNADTVFKAVGQAVASDVFGDIAGLFDQKQGKLLVDDQRKTSVAGVWAGGDCIFGHDDLTVTAVQDGKIAAQSIDACLRGREER